MHMRLSVPPMQVSSTQRALVLGPILLMSCMWHSGNLRSAVYDSPYSILTHHNIALDALSSHSLLCICRLPRTCQANVHLPIKTPKTPQAQNG